MQIKIKNSSITYNIVFMGVSINEGMAGTKRVKNIIRNFDTSLILLANIIPYKNSGNFIKKGKTDIADSKAIHCKVYYIGGALYLIKGIITLVKLKRNNSKNILYSYGYPDVKNIIHIIFAKLIGYKIVFDIVEDNEKIEEFKSYFSKLRFRSSIILSKYIHLFGDSCIVISHYLSAKLRGIFHDRIPVYLIPVSVNIGDFSKITDGENQQTKRLFYGGSFGPKDGIEFLIGGFEKVVADGQNLQLILTGKGSDRDEIKLKERIASSTAKKNIIFKGFLTEEDYYFELLQSHYFCVTRTNSEFAQAGFPFKLGEYLATGKAVIVTNIGSISHYLKHLDNAVLIEPQSVEDIAKAILFLIENPTANLRIGNRGRETAKIHFNAKNHADYLLEIFQNL